MKTYTRPWDADRVVERSVGDRRDSERRVRRGPLPPNLDNLARDQRFDWFVQDIANTMAFTPGPDGQRVSYRIKGGDREVKRRVAEAVAPDDPIHGRDRYGRVAKSVEDWMEGAWYDVARYSRAVHEVARLLPAANPEKAEPHGVALIRIDPREVGTRWGRFGGALVHRTSGVDRREWGLAPKVRLEGDRFAVLTLPDELGRVVREAVAGLRSRGVGSVLSVAPWSHPDLYELGYTLGDHSTVRDAVVARATRETGWYGRSQFDKHITSHYLVRRRIREGRFTARLRSAMLSHLNSILARHAERIGAPVEIVTPNAFTVADYDEAERMLATGSHSFRDVMNRVGR